MKTLFTLIFSLMIMSAGAQNFSWTAQASGTTEWLNDVQFVDNMHGWAVGNNGTIVATVDGGDNWTAQTSGYTEQLRGLFFLDQDTGWVVGGFSSGSLVVLKTTDGGANWTDLETVIPEEAFLKEIQFADADHGYALALSNIYYSADGGVSWEKGTLNSSFYSTLTARGLYVTSDTSAFACGTYRTSATQTRPGVFQNFTNSLGEWVHHGAGDFDTDDELNAIYFTDAQKGFTGGRNGKIYTMEESGGIFPGPWENNFDSGSGSSIQSIDFPTNENGMFNTSTEVDGQTIALVYHTEDAGVTWSSEPDSIPGMLSTLSAPDSENAWLAGSAGQIFKGEQKDYTSVSDHASFEFLISPNPFISSIRIESPDSYQGVQLSVFSYTGQVMKSVYLQELQESYELEGLDFLKTGVYFINLNSVDGKLNSTRKIVKF
ncbi:MAG: T9SS type A sorting domain-containing protein [Bacteroidetes bacterium]|nr:T9SS type A sorting domain-containing protein [Bacteroidota bacterium]